MFNAPAPEARVFSCTGITIALIRCADREISRHSNTPAGTGVLGEILFMRFVGSRRQTAVYCPRDTFLNSLRCLSSAWFTIVRKFSAVVL